MTDSSDQIDYEHNLSPNCACRRSLTTPQPPSPPSVAIAPPQAPDEGLKRSEGHAPRSARTSPLERPEKRTKNIVNNTVVSPWQFSVAYATSLWHRRKTPSRWSDSITPIELAEQSLHPRKSSNPSRKWQKVAVFRGAFQHPYTTVNKPPP